MAKADIELSSRTIIMLVLFIVIVVVIVGLAIMLSLQGTAGVENITNIAESFKPVT